MNPLAKAPVDGMPALPERRQLIVSAAAVALLGACGGGGGGGGDEDEDEDEVFLGAVYAERTKLTATLSPLSAAIVSEAREFLSTGAPGMLPMFQTASVSTWELNANGTLTPRSQDILTGPSITLGPAAPTSACWIVVSPDRSFFWVTHASGAVIASFRLNPDGTILINGRAAVGSPAVVGPTPLATADGLVDIAVSSHGRSIFQLQGLRGTIRVYSVGSSASLTLRKTRPGSCP